MINLAFPIINQSHYSVQAKLQKSAGGVIVKAIPIHKQYNQYNVRNKTVHTIVSDLNRRRHPTNVPNVLPHSQAAIFQNPGQVRSWEMGRVRVNF